MKTHKNNNFDFLRFLFAIFVVVSHSYPLSGNNESLQWIYRVTNGQIVLASIGLNGFFVISGFFIFKAYKEVLILKITLKTFFKTFSWTICSASIVNFTSSFSIRTEHTSYK